MTGQRGLAGAAVGRNVQLSNAENMAMSETVKERVVQVLAKDVAPALGMDGALLEVVQVQDGVARIRLNGACGCCPSSVMTVIHGIEQELRRRVPEVEYVEVVP